MGRFIAFLLFLVLVVAICVGLGLLARYFTTRRRQRLAAKFAPELLRYEDLPMPVVEAFIEQRKQLDDAHAIMARMVGDPFFDLNTQYHTLITSWLKSQRKEIVK